MIIVSNNIWKGPAVCLHQQSVLPWNSTIVRTPVVLKPLISFEIPFFQLYIVNMFSSTKYNYIISVCTARIVITSSTCPSLPGIA